MGPMAALLVSHPKAPKADTSGSVEQIAQIDAG